LRRASFSKKVPAARIHFDVFRLIRTINGLTR
jgi:hypothetical protein